MQVLEVNPTRTPPRINRRVSGKQDLVRSVRVVVLVLTAACSLFACSRTSASDSTASPAAASSAPAVRWESSSHPGGGFKAPLKLASGEILAAVGSEMARSAAINCYISADEGKTWRFRSEMLRDDRTGVDMGDGDLKQLPDGQVLYSFRHNRRDKREGKEWNIKILQTKDDGRTWTFHSTVSSHTNSDAGLWSSFLFQRQDGVLQCYYDDEYTPSLTGFPGHQWATMKTWDGTRWVNPVTVSRAKDPAKLSRDGMCSVCQISESDLICVVESVQTEAPFRGCLRMITSSDGGAHWSWSAVERKIVYAPSSGDFNALAPWMIKLANGDLLVVFTTDEDRDQPGEASTGVLFMDLKYLISKDSGKSWRRPGGANDVIEYYTNPPVSGVYFPGVTEVSPGKVLVQYMKKRQHRCKAGLYQ